jgi:hypothetical protein
MRALDFFLRRDGIGSGAVKFRDDRPLGDPETAVQKLLEIANAVPAVQDGRIHIELVNAPFLAAGGTPDEYSTALKAAIDRGWLTIHRSGVYVTFTQAGAELFA